MKRDPFAAIADPTRREILDLLARDRCNLQQISEHFSHISRQAVAKQVKYLSDSGLVYLEKSGRETYCCLKLENLAEVDRWIRQFESFWNGKLDGLGAYLDRSAEP